MPGGAACPNMWVDRPIHTVHRKSRLTQLIERALSHSHRSEAHRATYFMAPRSHDEMTPVCNKGPSWWLIVMFSSSLFSKIAMIGFILDERSGGSSEAKRKSRLCSPLSDALCRTATARPQACTNARPPASLTNAAAQEGRRAADRRQSRASKSPLSPPTAKNPKPATHWLWGGCELTGRDHSPPLLAAPHSDTTNPSICKTTSVTNYCEHEYIPGPGARTHSRVPAPGISRVSQRPGPTRTRPLRPSDHLKPQKGRRERGSGAGYLGRPANLRVCSACCTVPILGFEL